MVLQGVLEVQKGRRESEGDKFARPKEAKKDGNVDA